MRSSTEPSIYHVPRIGKPRIVFMNYGEGESPLLIPPEIILVRPRETDQVFFNIGRFWENLGVLMVASHLESCGIKFGFLEADLFRCSTEKTVNLILQYSPRFVGISAFATVMLDECLKIASRIKKRRGEIITVLGGHGVSLVHKEVLEDNRFIDMVIRGEGEKSLVEVIKAENSGAWKNIGGVSYREGDEIRVNAAGPQERNIDVAALPHRFARDLMMEDPLLASSPPMSLSSRGCFDRCKFCSVTAFYSNTWRGRSANHVVDEIEMFATKYRAKCVHFWDDLFIGPGKRGRDRAVDISEEIIRRKLDITFHITTRTPGLDEELIQIMHRAGLRSVFLGLESANQESLDFFGKHARVEDNRKAVDLLWKNGVYRILAGYIVFHDRMSWSEYRENLDFLESLPFVQPARLCQRLGFYPGTEFWNEQKHKLGKRSYKKIIACGLPDDSFEKLAEISNTFLENTLGIEGIFDKFEDHNLHDDAVIKYLASSRKRLFLALSTKLRLTADRLESGEDMEQETIRSFCREIAEESLRIIDDARKHIQDPFMDYLSGIYQIDEIKKAVNAKKSPDYSSDSRLLFA